MLNKLAQGPAQRGRLPCGLVSLLDIMERFQLDSFIYLERLREGVGEALRLDAEAPTMGNALLGTLRGPEERRFSQVLLGHVIEDMVKACKKFKLENALQNIEPLLESPPQTDREVAIYYDMMMRELRQGSFFQMSRDRSAYWRTDRLLSDAVKARFISVAHEIKAAATAYACALPEASVFHSMRAAEVGLLEVAQQLGVPVTGEEMLKNVIDGIQAAARKIDDAPRYPDKKSDSQFYSDVALEGGLMKDAWRNYVAHAKATYSEQDALDILNATCRFFEKFAKRDEQPAP